MRKTRTLALTRETLTPLTGDELHAVAGGSHLCDLTDDCTHASLNAPCPTLPVLDCLSIVTA